jgi:predicted component of viral defense system (DUF524 family)
MDQLLQIETDSWRVDVVGAVREIAPFISPGAATRIESDGPASLRVFSRLTNQLEPLESGHPIEPVFFENTDYDFYLHKKDGGNTRLVLPLAATRHHSIESTAHYSLNFRNDVGFFQLTITSESTGATNLRFEVFPSKMDYRVDYTRMRDEVAGLVRNLVMTVQARTFGTAAARPIRRPTLNEWFSLLRRYFDTFLASASAISRNPHSQLVKTIESVSIERSRKVERKALTRQLRKPLPRTGVRLPGSGLLLPERVPGINSAVTFDTTENRYVKALLLQTRRNVQRLIRTSVSGDEDADLSAEERFFEAVRPQAQSMLRRVQVLLGAPYLRGVATVAPRRPSSMVFHQNPKYAAFDRTARILNGGLALEAGLLQIGVKDISLLYEYWCFLKLTDLLAERFDLEQQTLARVKHLKIVVVLEKGVESGIRFKQRSTGKQLMLVYNRIFNRLPTVGQRPDNVIQLSSGDNLYIFDAKYRLSFDSKYQSQYGGPGPTIDDINTMHRYRDSIVVPHPVDRGSYLTGVVRGAAVLFPFRNELAYRGHKLYRSLASVNIGGLPFLPGTTELVEEKLQGILAEHGYES